MSTDAQWASTAVTNRRSRDLRRERRKVDPAFRAAEAVAAKAYRDARVMLAFEAIACKADCGRFWHRLKGKPGTKPLRLCAVCAVRDASRKVTRRRLRVARLTEGLCPKCCGELDGEASLCPGCLDYAAGQRKVQRR